MTKKKMSDGAPQPAVDAAEEAAASFSPASSSNTLSTMDKSAGAHSTGSPDTCSSGCTSRRVAAREPAPPPADGKPEMLPQQRRHHPEWPGLASGNISISKALALALALALVAGCLLLLPQLKQPLIEGCNWLRALEEDASATGTRSAVYAGFTALFVAWTVLCLPTTPMEIACGFVFGFRRCILANTLGKTGGSLVAFALGRALLGPAVLERMSARAAHAGLVARVTRAITRHPLKATFLFRLLPMPLSLKNYTLSALPRACGVTLRRFALATFAVNLPYTLAWGAIGSAAGASLRELTVSDLGMASGGSSPMRRALVVLSAGSMLVLFGLMGCLASSMLKEDHDATTGGAKPKPTPARLVLAAG